jgi:hypothetical protein
MANAAFVVVFRVPRGAGRRPERRTEVAVAGILKFFGSVVGIIFLIGLIVVVGLLMLIF